MAIESVATESVEALHVEHCAAPPVHGNFTTDADGHLWCAGSLATALNGEGYEAFNSWNDDIKQGLLYLLSSEISRAQKALEAEREETRSRRRGAP